MASTRTHPVRSRLVRLLRWFLGFYGRLPLAFGGTFPVLLAVAIYAVGHCMTLAQFEDVEAWLVADSPGLAALAAAIPLPLKILGEGALFLALTLGAVLISFNLSVALARANCRKTAFPVSEEQLDPRVPPEPSAAGPLAGLRIGLVLAGGGAKGVYQAGALKAIHEYLEAQGALGQVRVVSGTSIGSWNSLCWAAGLLGARPGEASPHERWWKTTPMARVVAPGGYWPMQNFLFSSEPWRQHYDAIFADNPGVRERLHSLGAAGETDPLHLYLTRSNVREARLGFSTNRPRPPGAAPGWEEGDSLAGLDEDATLQAWKEAVFASMDLPPAFAFTEISDKPGEVYEDGGVVDNLPTRFVTRYEDCDLVFVLPLNSSFERVPSRYSIFARLMRVLDVRQGELERRSMLLLQTRNQLRRARGERPLAVFAVCPGHPLAVSTLDFGTADITPSFDGMYEATKRLLAEEMPRCLRGEEVRLFRVGPGGEQVTAESLLGAADIDTTMEGSP